MIISLSEEETVACGKELAQRVGPNAIICLFGDLGAGKTTFIKGVVSGLTEASPEQVCSPTYAYLNIYEGKCPVYHFDLYRLQDHEAFLSLGFEEYLFSGGVCCIEWSERIDAILPPGRFHVTIEHAGEARRNINCQPLFT